MDATVPLWVAALIVLAPKRKPAPDFGRNTAAGRSGRRQAADRGFYRLRGKQ